MRNRWKLNDRNQLLWVGLFSLCNIFFILLAWLAYPASFYGLLYLMLVFSSACIGIGLWRNSVRKKRIKAALLVFLSNPDIEHEEMLMRVLDEPYRDFINRLGTYLREKEQVIEQEQEKVISYEEFIEAWVHEIKTPLSLAAIVLTNRKEEMTELVHQRFEHVTYRINENVERILYYARMQSTHSDYCYKQVLLSDCIEKVVEELHAVISEKHAHVVIRTAAIQVVTDEKLLQFILAQLIGNSLKYSDPDKTSRILMEAGIAKDGKKYNLEITDNGLGVAAADLPFIFDKGFTGNQPNRKKATGIGLYLVKHFCDEMQIEIQAESINREGLKIILNFPVVGHYS